MELLNSGKFYQLPPQQQVLMQQLWKVMDDLQRAVAESGLTLAEASTILLGYVQSVTDDGNLLVAVDNTDPQNPVIEFFGVAVDGVTITGDGLLGAPLTADFSGLVESVTGLDTDNTDPRNPIVQIAVDGVTITGQGTAADPLVAAIPSASVTTDGVYTEGDGTVGDPINLTDKSQAAINVFNHLNFI